MVNCVLHVEGAYHGVHREVLALVCPYLASLAGNRVNGRMPVIAIPNVSKETLAGLIQLIYEGRIYATKTQIFSIFKLAEDLGMKALPIGLRQALPKLVRRKCIFLDFPPSSKK